MSSGSDLDRFLERSVDMVCLLGFDGYYKRVNPAFERTLGFTSVELCARPFEDFVHPDDRAASLADLGLLKAGVQTGVYEERHLHKNGSYRWLHWTAVPASDGEGCFALARDVTERKEAEAELASSRARIAEAADAARMKIERDLHDGAQQRLVCLALQLQLIRRRTTDPAVLEMLDQLGDGLRLALDELRDLARGIHPTILTNCGLEVALNELASRCPVQVEVRSDLATRPAHTVEAAIYFVAAEALANVIKYASASHVHIQLASTAASVSIEIVDDGIGGADPAAGSGLKGLADRVEALGGTLNLSSPPGRGTTLRADIATPAANTA